MTRSPFLFSLSVIYSMESVSALISLQLLFRLFFRFADRVRVLAPLVHFFQMLPRFAFSLIIFKLVKSIQIGLKAIWTIAIAIPHIGERRVKENFASAIHTDVTTHCRAFYFGIGFAYSFHFLYKLQLTFINELFIDEQWSPSDLRVCKKGIQIILQWVKCDKIINKVWNWISTYFMHSKHCCARFDEQRGTSNWSAPRHFHSQKTYFIPILMPSIKLLG